MDQIDRRALAEYYIWLAFTAVPWPPDDLRFKFAHRYFTARGLVVL